ncbi:unnamed protein product [Peronospora farinosa]|uniref:RING-type domain-containing protein n=1 Tax=Peronospora farinosa TaxID=134698 RepID=A0AAV0SYS7_9STRA|nr:unnamed protein product [Peronospora farinosa]CAI5709789.1 unnamed protein product [Peronospora farinosa]
MDRNGSDTERRLHAIEAAFERERQQRDLLKKKYARLKRRYVRLERSHSRLLMEKHGNINRVETPIANFETPSSVESTLSLQSSTFAVIDLTSPCAGTSSAVTSSSGSLVSVSREMQGSQLNFLSRDDICSESPSSSIGSPEVVPRGSHSNEEQEERKMDEEEEGIDRETWRRSNRLYSTPVPRRRVHLDSTLPRRLTDSHRVLSSPPRRMQLYGLQSDHSTSSHSSPQSAHSMTTNSGEPRTRTRPRLHLHDHSPEQTAARAYGYELEQELEPRAHRHERYRWASDLSPEPSVPSPVVSSPLVPRNPSLLPPTVPLPASHPRAQNNEEASLALARYLQQQENIAAYEEYETRLYLGAVEQEYSQRFHHPASSLLSGVAGHQRNIDPDNMTYEELLRLGEEVGDVKKERWRRMAMQVLSSLPIHHWTRGHVEDTCIICQYDFMQNDRAMTLPCAHVFHEDCVGDWIRENNSCPLCKREIAPI